MKNRSVTIVGAGLAGSEAALTLAHAGCPVTLYEMRPTVPTEAHTTDKFCELLCSNSLRGTGIDCAPGILKWELEQGGSHVFAAALRHQVPAGGALAVDRAALADDITAQIEAHPNITVKREEVRTLVTLPDAPTILAPGPLASPALTAELETLFGKHLYFYDAIAPIVDGTTIDMEKTFFAARYGKGDPDYLNCPMNQEEYLRFHQALVSGERVKPRDFEKEIHFEGCMPIEEMADRGVDTLRYGPLKPVGLYHPVTGEAYYAVVQLRKETATGNMYNLVGFQTKLTYSEQRRVFRMIPGLEQVEFFRLGSMHRNTYINAPRYLESDFRVRQQPHLWLAGQISGVEGYIESIASGLVAAWSVLCAVHGEPFAPPPPSTAIGALCRHIVTPSKNFQPMNINFGLFKTLPPHRKLDRKRLYGKRAQEEFSVWLAKQPLRF